MRRIAILLPLVAWPILEIFVISRVGTAIGAGRTVLLLMLGVIAGALAIKYEGRRALNRLTATVTANAEPNATLGVPTREANKAAADAGLVILGGILLIIPGFISDAFGVLCLLPFTRPLVRRVIGGTVGRQLTRRTRFGAAMGQAHRVQDQMRMRRPDSKIVPGEVVHDDTPGRDDTHHDGGTVWRPGDSERGQGRLPG